MTAILEEPRAAPAEPGPSATGATPFIVRLAGLPASAALEFRSDSCREALEEISSLAEDLSSLRSELADRLFDAVPMAPPELRRGLLAAKRHCFNGRELRSLPPAALAALRPWAGELLPRLVEREERRAALQAEFEKTYGAARDRVRSWLLGLGSARELRRGLALASRELVEGQSRLARKSYAEYGRKERSAERSLARYVVRAAVKLSPYSTFTRLGLGLALPRTKREVRILGHAWERRSSVRLKSYLPNQWEALLLRIPGLREELEIDLNDTLEDLGEGGQHRLLRPWMLRFDEAVRDFQFVRPSLVKVRLTGPLIEWLKAELGRGRIRYAKLIAQAAADFGAAPEDVSSLCDRFLDIGVLRLLPPWPSYEPHPERRMLEFLNGAGWRADFDPVRTPLRRLVEVEEGYASTDDPAAALREIESLTREVFTALRDLLLPGSSLAMESGRQDIYEDVLAHLPPGTGPSLGGEILHLDRATADELFSPADLLWRIRGLFERRHEGLHALWHSAREHWPVGAKVPCLRLFAELEGIWKRYVDHLVTGGERLFNPFDLAPVRELDALRSSLVEEIVDALEDREDGYHLSVESLRRLRARVPARYQATTGPCLMIQPGDAAGELWVAHRLGDGSGRFSSRFNTLLQEPQLSEFTGHFAARSSLEVEGRPAQLLDLLFTQLTTVNRHWPQTHAVLETPGERVDLPADRIVRPSELFIEIGEECGALRMCDRDGRRYLPCFLSALHSAWVPTFVKFLALFGVDTRARLDIPAPVRTDGGIERQPRLTAGRLVFRRERWIVPVGQIPRSGVSEAALYAAIWNWRRAAGLPERVFWIERLPEKVKGIKLFKPQYIDFNSPTLVDLLVSGLEERVDSDLTTFEEALPTPESFPKDDAGQGWGTELTLESVAFQEPSRGEWVTENRFTFR